MTARDMPEFRTPTMPRPRLVRQRRQKRVARPHHGPRPLPPLGAAVLAAAGTATLLVVGTTLPGLLPTAADPDAVVAEYIEAIDRGDVEAATTLSAPDPAVASTALLTNEAAAAAALATVECEPAAIDGTTATASCTWAGSGLPVVIELESTGGGWHITQGLERSVVVLSAFAVASVGGVELPASVASGEPVWLLPGEYPAEPVAGARADLEFFGGAFVDDLGGGVGVYAVPGPAFAATAEVAAESLLASCAADAGDPACPAVEPAAPTTTWTATWLGEAWNPEAVVAWSPGGEVDAVYGAVLVQRLDDGVPTASYRVVAAARLDGEAGDVDFVEDPESFL